MTEAIGEPTSHKDRRDIVHGSYCNMCNIETEIKTIEGGQKDVLLRRTNIKKSFYMNTLKSSSAQICVKKLFSLFTMSGDHLVTNKQTMTK